MKLSDFTDKNPDFRAKTPQIMAVSNEAKEAKLASQIAELERKLASIEQIADEKVRISGVLETQQGENSRLVQESAQFEAKISHLEGQLQEKERFLTDLESLKHQNEALLLNQGEVSSQMANLRLAHDVNMKELEQIRVNNANLEITEHSLSAQLQNKEALLDEMSKAMSQVSVEYEGLIASSDHLAKQYTEMVDNNHQLNRNNVQLTDQVATLQKQQQILEETHKRDKESYRKAIEQRIRGSVNHQVEELQQDVDDLVKINNYYKTELSKPQQMSVGAIARQEKFKIPLASSAINYRTNNLGTAQPTLLKFSSREVVNDN